ncbi:MAG: recombinase family protein [bacterium]
MENIGKEIKIIATYARVSTARQEEEQTIKTQIDAMNDFIKDKGYEVVQVYEDEGWSGDTLERPQLDQLRLDAQKKMWDAVL